MKTMKTLSRRIAALLLVVTVGITALAPAASASCPACRKINAWWTTPVC
jgi:hypothetical protein